MQITIIRLLDPTSLVQQASPYFSLCTSSPFHPSNAKMQSREILLHTLTIKLQSSMYEHDKVIKSILWHIFTTSLFPLCTHVNTNRITIIKYDELHKWVGNPWAHSPLVSSASYAYRHSLELLQISVFPSPKNQEMFGQQTMVLKCIKVNWKTRSSLLTRFSLSVPFILFFFNLYL